MHLAASPSTGACNRPPSPTPPAAAPQAHALRAAVAALVPELRVRAMRLCGNHAAADDLVQDAVERALRFEHHYAPGTNLRAWMHQILFRVFVTTWRRRRRERVAVERLASDPCAWTLPDGFAPPDVDRGSLSPSVQRDLDALPTGFRAVVEMVDLEQRSYKDAARQLGVPVGTVMSRLHRARKLLAAQLTRECSERSAA